MPRRRLVLILVAAALVAGGAVAVPLIRKANGPFELSTTWGDPAVIDVEAEGGEPLAAFQSALAAATGPVEIGGLTLDPKQNGLAKLTPVSAADGVTGAVPSWFPTLTGAQQLGSKLTGRLDEDLAPGGPRYTARQDSLVLSKRSLEDIGSDVADVLEDTWPEVRSQPEDDGSYLVVATGKRVGFGVSDRLEVDVVTSTSFPGLVLVNVYADYLDNGALRPSPRPVDKSLAGVSVVAASEGWPVREWYETEGADSGGSVMRGQSAVWSAASGTAESIADDIVGQLGTPNSGNVEGALGVLQYSDGSLRIDVNGRTDGHPSIRWNSAFAENRETFEPGPLAALKSGVPAAEVSLNAKPFESAVGQERMTDAIWAFAQPGMLAIDGAVALDIHSSVTVAPGGSTRDHHAYQLVVVDTPLTVEDVGAQLKSVLAELGATEVQSDSNGFWIRDSKLCFRADTPRRGGVGNANYTVDIGSLPEFPGKLAIWIDVSVYLAGGLPEAPEVALKEFAAPRAAAEADWTPARWYATQSRAEDGRKAALRKGFGWLSDVRGPKGLEATTAVVQKLTGLEPADLTEGRVRFEGSDSWTLSLEQRETYERVDIGFAAEVKELG